MALPLPPDSLALKFLPFLAWTRELSWRTLRADLLAALTGAIIVLPQGVAFALIAGLPPEYGLYTAIVVPAVAGLFGSSRHLVSGPTTAISIVVLGVVGPLAAPGTERYLEYVLTLTFLAGLFQLLLGLARMGTLVNFISHTVVVGFTTGAAVLIAVSQLGHFFGMPLLDNKSFLHTLGNFIWELDNYNGYVVIIAATTLAAALLARRYLRRWPPMLAGLVAGSLASLLLDGPAHGVPMVGALPGHLPPPSEPQLSLDTVRLLASGAMAVAVLGLIEAVAVARAVATRTHQRIDSNQEFIAQGLANLTGSFFSCYAGSGSFTRTGLNYESGARTPLSAIIASLLVAGVLVFFAPLTAWLPMPAMAGVIMLVAWSLVDTRRIRQIVRASRRDTAVLVVTVVCAVFIGLEFAIYAGVLLSLVLYLQRTSHPRIISLAPHPARPRRPLSDVRKHDLLECPQLKILRLDGSLFFGAVDHLQDTLYRLAARNADWKRVLMLCSNVNFIDVAGAEMLAQEAQRLRQKGGGLYLVGLNDSVRRVLENGGFLDIIGAGNVFTSKEQAIFHIFRRLDPERCAICARRIFRECDTVEFQGRGVMSS
ncbi:MAG: SulP family inorganic anion transporter [Pseudomonadota bacterium]|nr:SulP family inorganic anion transporter [Pseudomonadota bacterium]